MVAARALTKPPAPPLLAPLLGGALEEAELDTLILSLPEAERSSHFGTTDFRVRGKIFATRPRPRALVLKLTPEQQELLCAAEGETFRRLPNKWGDRGWTEADVNLVDEATARSALAMAWGNVAPRAVQRGH